MKKHMKKVVSIMVAVVMILGISTTSYAVTPQYHSWVPKIDLSGITLPDSVKNDINDMVDDWLDDHPIKISVLSKPSVTEANYRHQKVFYDKARLQIRWNKVEGVEYYKIKVTKKDGTYKEYTTTNTSLFVYSGSDNFITDCVRSGNVQVMACSDSDGVYDSSWSASKTITCNSLHR